MKKRSYLDSALIFLAAFLWFGGWNARGKTPFCDYPELFNHLGIHGLSPLYHWTYHFWIRGVLSFFKDGAFWTLMAYSSALFASLNTVLVFRLCQRIPHSQSTEEFSRVYPEKRVDRFSGYFAALFFAVSTPVLFSATTIQIHHVNVFLFLFVSWLTLSCWKRVTEAKLLCLGLFTGFVLIEYMAAWLILPFQMGIVGYSIWVSSLSTRRLSFIYLVSLTAGVSVFILVLLMYQKTSLYEWRDFDSSLQLFRVYWRDHVWSLTKPLPRVGWILVFISTLMPFFWIAIPKRSQNSTGSHYGSVLLHGILFITLCLTLLNSPLSPWELLGEKQVVLPYAAAAIAFGYLVGYAYILVGFSLIEQKQRNSKAVNQRRIWLGLVVVLLAIGAVQSLYKVNHAPADAIRQYVKASLPEKVSGKDVLVSGGWIARMQQPVRTEGLEVLDLSKSRSTTYKEYLASTVSSSRSMGLARISVQAYLTEYLQAEANREKAAVFNHPNLWMGLGLKALPNPLSYSGVTEISKNELDQSRVKLRRLQEEIVPSLTRIWETSAYHPYADFVLLGLSKTLNNLGVLYHERNYELEALECYQWAQSAYSENISAKLNQLTLLEDRDPEQFTVLSEELMTLLDDEEIQPNIWSLSYMYGFVYHVQTYVQRGLSWASSGRSLAAQAEFQKAAQMGAKESDIQLALSRQLLSHGEGSSQNENALLQPADEPEINELLRSIHQKIMNGNVVEAREDLKSEKLNSAPRQVIVLSILADLKEGRIEDALLKIQTAPMDLQNHPRMLMLRIGLEPAMDTDVVEKLENLERNGRLSLEDIQMLAEILIRKGNLDGAVGVYQRAVLRNPSHIGLLEKLIGALAMKGDKESIRRYVTAMLELSPSNPTANRYLGMFQIEDREFELAVESFRESYRGDPTADTAMNLAWLLQEIGEIEEAYSFAIKAVEQKSKSSDAYHTLGLIQLKQGNLEASEQTLLQAIELQPLNPLAKLYLAMLYTEKGEKDQARILLDDIQDQVEMMMPIFRERYEALRVGM